MSKFQAVAEKKEKTLGGYSFAAPSTWYRRYNKKKVDLSSFCILCCSFSRRLSPEGTRSSSCSHARQQYQMVNSHLVCDPTIRQPGFDLPRKQWSLLNRFRTEQGHCGACRTEGNGDLQTLICVLVARPRRCLTLSNPVPWQNWIRLISATLCGWRRCFVADQLWFMTCTREEEKVSNVGIQKCHSGALRDSLAGNHKSDSAYWWVSIYMV